MFRKKGRLLILIKLLSNLIYDKQTNWLVTFNLPESIPLQQEIISLALDVLYEKKYTDSKNIKCFDLSSFRLIMNGRDYCKYIQDYPKRGKEKNIMD